jgi:hypothetical protein
LESKPQVYSLSTSDDDSSNAATGTINHFSKVILNLICSYITITSYLILFEKNILQSGIMIFFTTTEVLLTRVKTFSSIHLQRLQMKVQIIIMKTPMMDSPMMDSPMMDSPMMDSPMMDSPMMDSPMMDSQMMDSQMMKTQMMKTHMMKIIAAIVTRKSFLKQLGL